jgi:hypothetical protein
MSLSTESMHTYGSSEGLEEFDVDAAVRREPFSSEEDRVVLGVVGCGRHRIAVSITETLGGLEEDETEHRGLRQRTESHLTIIFYPHVPTVWPLLSRKGAVSISFSCPCCPALPFFSAQFSTFFPRSTKQRKPTKPSSSRVGWMAGG